MRIQAQVLRTHRLLCLGIIRPLVGQEGCKLARGSNKDIWVCRIRQTAGINAIYLRVALDEVRGSGHQGVGDVHAINGGQYRPVRRAGYATRVERFERGWDIAWQAMLHLRLSPARGHVCSSLRALFVPQYLKNARYYSQLLPSLPPQQPWPGARPSLRRRDLGSELVRLDGSPHDAGNSSAGSPPPSSPSSPGGDNPDSSDPPSPPPADSSPPPSTSISRQSVPENYPQVLALPIARRPLFPGFYKAVVIRNPHVVAAVKEMMKRGQPYLGAFLLKDEQADSDVITDINSVHPVGVFAQITSVFAAASGPGKEDEKEEGLTAVLYPHRRIKITDLVKASGSQSSAAQPGEVDSSVTSSQEQPPTPPPSPQPTDPELPVDHAKRHPGAPAPCGVVANFSAYGFFFQLLFRLPSFRIMTSRS